MPPRSLQAGCLSPSRTRTLTADDFSPGITTTIATRVSGSITPSDVHYGRAEIIRAQCGNVLDAAYAAHPERFVRKAPEPPALPTVAWINEPKEDATTAQ